MKNIKAYIAYGILAVVLVVGTVYGVIESSKAKHGSSMSVSDKEPSDPYGGMVETVEGTTTDMLLPEYWLGTESSEDILFSTKEIDEFNYNNPYYIEFDPEDGRQITKIYTMNCPDTLDAEVVKGLINPEIIDEVKGEEEVYVNGELPEKDYWDKIVANMNLDSIPGKVTPQYAISVTRTDARILPSDDFIANDPEEIYFDNLISAELMPFCGVVILNDSSDGNWSYVVNGSYCGWVHKDTLAMCESKEEWDEACSPEEFLMVMGSEIVLEETARKTAASGMILPMGTKIKLAIETSESVNDRKSWGSYVVEIPVRDDNGNLGWEKTLIPISKDVYVGYPQMTAKAVVEQAFKFLGNVYGYGGTLSSNDCSGFVRQVYQCFGLELPRNARAIAKNTDLGSVNCADMTIEKRLSLLEKMLPGTLLFMDGHIMMYLGTKEGVPYVISSCATCIEPGHDTTEIVDAYSVFVSSMELKRASGKTWLEDMEFILCKDY